MKNLFSVPFILFFSLNIFLPPSFAQEKGPRVATVSLLKGSLILDGVPLKEGDQVKEGDTVRTTKSSFARLTFNDETIVNLGSESAFFVKSYRDVDGKRRNNLKILKGKVRVWVNKMATPGEELNFNAQQVSLGVRGTEFLVNAYEFGGAPSSDVLLVKGSLQASGTGFNSFTMEPGQFFNSQDLLRNGMQALKTLSKDALMKIKDGADVFMPDLQTPNGLLDLGEATLGGAVGAVTGLATGLLASGGNEEKKEPEAQEKVEKVEAPLPAKIEKKNSSKVKGLLDFKYDLKKEKWDIRDAVINREKNKKNNRCFYFFYKQLPGAGEPERFRRERDCDEFEYDL